MVSRSIPHDRYSHKEGHQLHQGLLLGVGSKLRNHLDDLVHDAAEVTLELLSSLLHELGILGTQMNVCTQYAVS